MTPLRVLLLEDSEYDAELILYELTRGGFRPAYQCLCSETDLALALERPEWDLIISDYSMPSFTGVRALEMVRAKGLDIPFIIVSGTIGEEIAVAAMRAGAQDYVMKNNLTRLTPAIQRELQEQEMRRKHQQIEKQLQESEERLRHSQRMEAIGRLAAGIAHDFSNLLMVITSHAGLALNDLEPAHPVRDNLKDIQGAVDRASALTRQLLAFGRKQGLVLQVMDLNAAADEAGRMLKPLLHGPIRFTSEPASVKLPVKADPGQIHQVIMNLVLNARDALPGSGEIALKTALVELESPPEGSTAPFRPGAYALISVRDTGAGMDAETLKHIFEPFFTTKESGKGTGLGLATVYGIVGRFGGHIGVDSEPGRGTVFSVYLPAHGEDDLAPAVAWSPAAAAAPQAGPEVDPESKGTILVVDDEEALRRSLKSALGNRGYKVLASEDAGDALAAAGAEPIDLMITDLNIGAVGGYSLSRKIRERHPRAKILFMSGYFDGEAVPTEAGPSPEMLQKPFSTAQLVERIEKMLGAA